MLVSVRVAMCCDCVEIPVKTEVKRARVVFTGTIAKVTDSQIVFSVERVYKGRVPATFAMAKFVMEADCASGFAARLVRTGNELLVYAWNEKWFHEGLLSGSCSRTAFVQDASEDFKRLGAGRPPSPK